MTKKKLSISLMFLMGLLSSCQTKFDPTIKDQIVDKVDIQRFMGDWFVIASIPTPFEKDVYNGLESYRWNEEEERVDILFSYYKKRFYGDYGSISQKGWVMEQGEGAYWKVSPLWPLKFGYLVIELDPDYQWTVVGVPDKSYAWIMARTPQMEEAPYQRAVKRLKDLGYNLEDLKKVPQNGEKPRKN